MVACCLLTCHQGAQHSTTVAHAAAAGAATAATAPLRLPLQPCISQSAAPRCPPKHSPARLCILCPPAQQPTSMASPLPLTHNPPYCGVLLLTRFCTQLHLSLLHLCRPPAALRTPKSLSAASPGHVLLLEYMEQRPLLMLQPGMGLRLTTLYRRRGDADVRFQALQAEYLEGLLDRQVRQGLGASASAAVQSKVARMRAAPGSRGSAAFSSQCYAGGGVLHGVVWQQRQQQRVARVLTPPPTTCCGCCWCCCL